MHISFNPFELSPRHRELVVGFLIALNEDAPVSAITIDPKIEGHLKQLHDAFPGLVTSPVISDGPEQTAEEAFGPIATPVIASPSLMIPPPVVEDNMIPLPAAAGQPNEHPMLDKTGLPWDARIHASTKTMIANGSWKMKRGVSEEEVAKITAQLRQVMNAPAAPVAVEAPPINVISMPVPVATVQAPPAIQPPPVNVQPVATVQPPANEGSVVIGPDYDSFFVVVNLATEPATASKFRDGEVDAICKTFGLTAFSDLSMRLDLVPAIYQRLMDILKSRS